MENLVGATPKFDWESGDLPQAWKSFKQHAEFMFNGPLKDKSEEERCNYLMIWVGDKGRQVYSTWTLSDEEKKLLKTYYDKFEKYVEPKSNKVFARFKFQSKVQAENETFEQFVTSLKVLFKDCGYQNQDEMVRDRIVFGIKTEKVRERLIHQGSDLKLEKAIDIARLYEMSQAQLKTMSEDHEDSKVHVIRTGASSKSSSKYSKGISGKQTLYRTGGKQFQTAGGKTDKCDRCGYKAHTGNEPCPAKGQECRRCHRKDHFERMCWSKNVQPKQKFRQRPRSRNIHAIDDLDVDEFEDSLFIGMLGENDWTETLLVNNKEVKFQLDTGAKCNVISYTTFKSLDYKTALKQPDLPLKSYSGHKIDTLGMTNLPCRRNVNDQSETHAVKFYVVDLNAPNVLGAETCQNLELVKRVNSVASIMGACDFENKIRNSEYPDVFKGLGCLPGVHSIKVDTTVNPVIHPPRKIPLALQDKVRDELNRMEREGIIVRQDEPTQWVNSMVVVSKPNKIRICIDPKDLNRAILREHFPLKTIEEVVAYIPGAKIFSKLDATSGFWQIKLDEESSKLCTFNTPHGRYRFTRMPFGIKSAPEVFQRIMSQMVENIDGAEAIMDDVLVWGTTVEEHDARLRKVMEKARAYNLKLSPGKCEFRRDEVSYVGHLLTKDGLKPDPEKIRAVEGMQPPSNKQELLTFLGFIQYLGKFMPHMSEVSAPLRTLTESKVAWHWTEKHGKSFETLKRMATKAPVLKYYDSKLPLTLSVDASSKGLGAVLVQEGQPVAYGSRALTSAQQNYAQIEKETLALVYGCAKFHYFVYGRQVNVETDHKPLQAIFAKPLYQAPMRLQRLLLTLQKYDLKVAYKPGKFMWLADTLSRSFLQETTEELIPEAEVNMVLKGHLPIAPEKYQEFQRETANDTVLQELQHVVLEGWPNTKKETLPIVHEYWSFRDEIACVDGLLFKGQRLIVPKSMRKTMLDIIHESHLGVVKCKSRAREVLYWPGMASQIEDTVSSCSVCAEINRKNAKEPLMIVEIPDRPWAKIAADLFELSGKQYFLTVDYYSKWPEINILENTTTKSVVTCLKSQFARYGIVDELVTDNGPQFSGTEFNTFIKEYGVKHTTTSPYHAQSNGQAERAVQTVKNLIKKACDPYKALLNYRNTPLDIGMSPAQMFLGRRLKTNLPTTLELLKPIGHDEIVHNELKQRQLKAKLNHDRNTCKELTKLHEGDKVMIQPQQHRAKWTHATVETAHQTPRSYVVQIADGRRYRRNRRWLRPTKSNATEYNSRLTEQCDDDIIVPRHSGREQLDIETNVKSDIPHTPKPVTDSVDTPVVSTASVKTRSGRTVTKPSKLKDYVP